MTGRQQDVAGQRIVRDTRLPGRLITSGNLHTMVGNVVAGFDRNRAAGIDSGDDGRRAFPRRLALGGAEADGCRDRGDVAALGEGV